MWVHRLGRVLVVLLVSMALDTTPVVAQTRTAPEATQHALDELANCRAQRRPECPTDTPTATLSPAWTPSPTATASSEPTQVATPEASATPAPCWLTDQDLGDPDNGYIVFDDSGAPVPCPTPGTSDTPTPTSIPATATPTVTPSMTSRPAAPVPAPQLEVRTVVQTVVVVVTAVPTDTPVATTSTGSTLTPRPSPTVAPTATATVSPTATGTPTVLAIGPLTRPTPRAPAVAGERQVGHWDWGGFLATVAGVLMVVALGAFLLTRRSVVRWGARPNQVEDPHA